MTPEIIDKEDFEKLLNAYIVENIEKGQSIYDIFKGQSLTRMSGHLTDQEALAAGHFGGLANGVINVINFWQKLLNQVSTMRPELVPIMKKTPQGMKWVTDSEEVEKLCNEYNYKHELVEGKYYFKYPGIRVHSTKAMEFAYDVARASGSFQGETKLNVTNALANLKAVPIFPQQQFRPMGELYGDGKPDQDAD